MHINLVFISVPFSDLILIDDTELDSCSELVLSEIANYIMDDELERYADTDEEDKADAIWMLHLVFHSELDEFREYFMGYYATPDNQLHQMNIDEGNTSIELYNFLDLVNWNLIFQLTRRHSANGEVARIFNHFTGMDYARECLKYPVEPWDGSPRWKKVDGKYVASE